MNAAAGLKDTRRLAWWSLGLYGVSTAAGILYDFLQSGVPLEEDLHLHDSYYYVVGPFGETVFAAVILATGLPSMILYLFWKYRAAHNARILDPAVMPVSPAMAVGSYFIPIANLAIPCAAMLGISRASTGGGRWVSLWWVGHIGAFVLGFASAFSADSHSHGGPSPFENVYTVWSILTFLVTWRLIMRITRAQTARGGV